MEHASENWFWGAGARVGVSPSGPDRLDTAARAGWKIAGIVEWSARLHHQWIGSGNQTALAVTVGAGTGSRTPFVPYGEIGLVRRYFRVGGQTPVPGPWGHDTAEWDALVQLGVNLPRWSGVSPRVGIATLDPFEVYRLNNPAAVVSAQWETEAVQWELTARYRILLGFGRLDEFAVRLSATLTPAFL